jgi:hypothetical protein
MFDHEKFSRDLKIMKAYYLEQGSSDAQFVGRHIHGLSRVDLGTIKTDNEKKAFWINVYNGLTNYWIIEKGIKRSMLERPLLVFFSKINIGGYQYSLDDIEHGILRKNQRSPIKFWRQFSDKDPRNAYKVEKLDYRIHFALNCGGKSCPALSFYTESKLEEQLKMAEENFAEQEFLVNKASKTISCSKIFKLYKHDFAEMYTGMAEYRGYKINYRKYDFSIK